MKKVFAVLLLAPLAIVAACGSDASVTEPSAVEGRPRMQAAIGTDPASGATIQTNLDDYSPGQVIHVTGTGWSANETVNLSMTEEPDTHEDVTMDVVADANGAFAVDFYDVQEHDVGVIFTLTGTGEVSGSVAVATFTDGLISGATLTMREGTCTSTPATFVVNSLACAAASFTVSGSGATPVQIRWTNGTTVFIESRSPSFPNGTSGTQTFQSTYTPTTAGTWTVRLCESNDASTSPGGVAGRCPGGMVGAFPDGSSNRAKTTFTVVADVTPPVITPNITGTLGNNGWYVSDVSVSWSITDPESSYSVTGCVPVTITADQTATTYPCSATSAGGTSSSPVTIKRDANAPNVAYTSALPASPNGLNGWYTTDVTATFTATDNFSGFGNPLSPNTTETATAQTSGEGMSVTVGSPAFTDNAGNVRAAGAASSPGFKIDKTKPVVQVTGVTNGETYILGSVPAAGCSTTDLPSGVASGVAINASLNVSGGPVGSVTATCSGAADNAGNTNSASVTYNVIYDWNGFFQPVENLPAWNSAKAGQSIPVKFSLGGDQGLYIIETGWPKIVAVTCPSSSATVDSIEEYATTTANNGLVYDPVVGQYNYVWKTDKNWAGKCFRFDLKLKDGTTHSASFKFTK